MELEMVSKKDELIRYLTKTAVLEYRIWLLKWIIPRIHSCIPRAPEEYIESKASYPPKPVKKKLEVPWVIYGICFLIHPLLIIGCIIHGSAKNRKLTDEHENSLDNWEKECEKIRKQDQIKNIRLKNEYDKKKASAHLVKANADFVFSYTQNALSSMKVKLNTLYSQQIIYPSYQNRVAVSCFIEYLKTNQCTELEGAGGCYALFQKNMGLSRTADSIRKLADATKEVSFALLYNGIHRPVSSYECSGEYGIVEDVVKEIAYRLLRVDHVLTESEVKTLFADLFNVSLLGDIPVLSMKGIY